MGKRCFLITGARRMDNRSRYPVRHHNDAIAMIQASNKAMLSFGAGPSVPALAARAFQQWTYATEDYAQKCPGGEWKRLRGAIPRLGLQHFPISEAYTRAGWLRANARANGPTSISGYGLVDTSDVIASDLLLNGSTMRVPITGWNQTEDYHYSTDVHANVNVPADFSDHTKADGVERTNANWAVDGKAGPQACGDGQRPFSWTVPPLLLGPLWDTGEYDEAGIDVYPKACRQSFGPVASNGMGGDSEAVRLGLGHWSPQVFLNVVDSCPIGFPHPFKAWPDEMVILNARMEVKIGSIDFYSATVTQASGGASVVIDESTDSFPLSVVLMGRSRVGTAYIWEALGVTVGSTIPSGLWIEVDATALVQSLLSHRRDKYDGFALVPSPGVDAQAVLTSKAFLMSMMPTFTPAYEYASSPADLTFENPGEGFYIAESSGSTIQWGSIAVGNLIVEYQYPSSQNGRTVTYFNTPRMTDG